MVLVTERYERYFLRLEFHSKALGSIKMIAGRNQRHQRHQRHPPSPSQLVPIPLFQTRKLKIQAQVLQKALLTETRSTQWKSELWLRCQ